MIVSHTIRKKESLYFINLAFSAEIEAKIPLIKNLDSHYYFTKALMKKLEQLFLKVYKPNPAAFHDEYQAAITFTKSKFIFRIHLISTYMLFLSIAFYGFDLQIMVSRYLLQFLTLAVFVICCRSHPSLG